MDAATILAFAIKALEAMPAVVQMTQEAISYLNSTVSSLKLMQLEGRDPTEAEWDQLNKTIEDLRAARVDLDSSGTEK